MKHFSRITSKTLQVSIGSFVCEPPHTQDVDSILHQVDHIMYAVKAEKAN